MLYDIVYALIIMRNRKKLNNSKMIDYRIDSWYNITNIKICASKEISYTQDRRKP